MSTLPLKAVVVDDEPPARDELVFLLSQCEKVDVSGEAHDTAHALSLCERVDPDIAFVDLRMPGPDGIALAEALLGRHPSLAVIVVSAHHDGAIRAFEARVLDYLLKPVRLERLRSAIERARLFASHARKTTAGTLDRLAVRQRGGSYVVVNLDDIIYFEVREETVWAVTRTDRFALDLSLATIEERVPPDQFFRSHRGFVVRINAVKAIEPTGTGAYSLLLGEPLDVRIPLARERVRCLRERIPFTG